MTPVVGRKPRAVQDLLDHFTYIGQRNANAAERFLEAGEIAIAHLTEFPLTGRPWKSASPRLAGIRSWIIPNFRNYCIFYRPIDRGIEVLHVIYARRNIQAILEGEEED